MAYYSGPGMTQNNFNPDDYEFRGGTIGWVKKNKTGASGYAPVTGQSWYTDSDKKRMSGSTYNPMDDDRSAVGNAQIARANQSSSVPASIGNPNDDSRTGVANGTLPPTSGGVGSSIADALSAFNLDGGGTTEAYQSPYNDQIQALMGQIANIKAPTYNVSVDKSGINKAYGSGDAILAQALKKAEGAIASAASRTKGQYKGSINSTKGAYDSGIEANNKEGMAQAKAANAAQNAALSAAYNDSAKTLTSAQNADAKVQQEAARLGGGAVFNADNYSQAVKNSEAERGDQAAIAGMDAANRISSVTDASNALAADKGQSVAGLEGLLSQAMNNYDTSKVDLQNNYGNQRANLKTQLGQQLLNADMNARQMQYQADQNANSQMNSYLNQALQGLVGAESADRTAFNTAAANSQASADDLKKQLMLMQMQSQYNQSDAAAKINAQGAVDLQNQLTLNSDPYTLIGKGASNTNLNMDSLKAYMDYINGIGAK